MRDYPTLHLDTNWSKGTAFIAVLHFRVIFSFRSII